MMYKEICGCIHLHTIYSDGGCDYPELIGAARDTSLDYICVTDHMTLDGRKHQGLHDGVFVLVGYEHNDDKNINHYLAFGTDKTAGDNVTVPQDYINRVKEMGGIGFLAHPAEKRDYLGPYPWTDWDVTGFDGIEIWNQISDWMEQLRDRWDRFWDRVERLFGRKNKTKEWGTRRKWWKVWKLFSPNRYIKSAPADLLKRWDDMNRERFVSGIAGVDAHTRKVKLGPFGIGYSIFPIKTELRALRTHLFVDEEVWMNAECGMRNLFISAQANEECGTCLSRRKPMRNADRVYRGEAKRSQCTMQNVDDDVMGAAIIEAMRDGRGFMSNYYRGDARGTKIFLRDDHGNVAFPGRQATPSDKNQTLPTLPMTMHVELPLKADIMLLRNGEVISQAAGKDAAWTITEPGVYRVEAHRKSRAWIYSNPFPIGQYPL